MSDGNLMDGRAIARQIHEATAQKISDLKLRGIRPGLAFVRVGKDPASQVYVGMKERKASELGVQSITDVLAESTAESEVLALIDRLNNDAGFHGILVQAPLPSHINSPKIYAAVRPEKDVDGFHPMNVGK